MMAAGSATANTSDATPSRNPSVNLRNPTPLSGTQEGEIRDLYYKRVRAKCAAEIKEFAACAINRTVTATWVCRKERLTMNSCMLAHAVPEEQDRAREEWFANRDARRRAREKEEQEIERRRNVVISMMREDEEKRKGA